MAKSVISVQMRSEILQKISDQAFPKENHELEARAQVAGEKLYRHFVSEEYEETMCFNLPHHFFDWRESLRVDVDVREKLNNGETVPNRFHFLVSLRKGEHVPLPAGISHLYSIGVRSDGVNFLPNELLLLPNELQVELQEIGQRMSDLKAAIKALRFDADHICNQLKTLKRLKDRAPALYDLIPAELLRPEPLLPTTMIGDVLTKLSAAGIPPQEEEVA